MREATGSLTLKAFAISAAIIAACGIGAWKLDALSSGLTDQSASITAEIGAQSCSPTSYEITNKLDGSKTRIYDCNMGVGGGGNKCITRESGLTHDRTDTVRLLFQNVLSGAKPTCAS